MNLTDLGTTPLHVAFEEVCRKAEARGLRVTGSELIGLVPLAAVLEAGRHFLRKQQRSVGVSEAELIKIAVKSLGLDAMGPFKPEDRIVEYRLRDASLAALRTLSLEGFVDETASESPAPGGGSVAAAVGALAVALGTMVANLSAHKPGWDERWAEFSEWAERGQRLKEALLPLVDEDSRAFAAVLTALSLPKTTPAEAGIREATLTQATVDSAMVPLKTMRLAVEAFDVLEAMAAEGNPASISDVGVGALCANAAVRGAWLNVRINLPGLSDKELATSVSAEAQNLAKMAQEKETRILQRVEEKLR